MIPQVGISLRNQKELNMMLNDIVESTWFSEGKYCQQYLELIQETLTSKHQFLAPNGTLGLFLALSVFKEQFPNGGDVLVPSFTFYGSATSIKFAGFNPIFVDCNPKTFQSDLEHFKEAHTPNTVGIMPVHIYGQIGMIKEICDWAKSMNLFSIEDAAQAFGCKKNGKSAGSFADIGVFSTFSDKIFTTGEGAILTTNNDDYAHKIKLIRNQGRPNAGTFTHPELGMNFRLTEFQAALGLHQLRHLKEELEERREKYIYYGEKLKEINGFETMELIEGSTLVPFRFPILSKQRELTNKNLNNADIQTRNFFVPMHLQPKFTAEHTRVMPNSEYISNHGTCLPIHCNISKKDIDYIIRSLA